VRCLIKRCETVKGDGDTKLEVRLLIKEESFIFATQISLLAQLPESEKVCYNKVMALSKICEFCGNNFSVPNWYAKSHPAKYCSNKCKGSKVGKRFKKGYTPWNKGLHVYLGGYRYPKGHIPWNKGKRYTNPKIALANKGKHYSPETEFKKGSVPWHKGTKGLVKNPWKGKKRPEITGEKHFNWKGGTSYKLKKGYKYNTWRKEVFERDRWTCVLCSYRSHKKRENGKSDIEADHIKPWSLFPKLRFEITNGRTLCYNCHRDTETYGVKGIKNYEHKNIIGFKF